MAEQLNLNETPVIGPLNITYEMIPILNHPDGEAFIYNHFINVECFKNSPNDNLNFCFLSQLCSDSRSWSRYLLDYQRVEDFASGGNVVSEIISCIDRGYYVYIHFDDFYLDGKLQFEKEHQVHINFIYGYDEEAQNFLSIGYNDESKYVKMDISFEQAQNGYYAYTQRYAEFFKQDLNKKYTFDDAVLIQQLRDYIESKNSIVTKKDLEFYGINKDSYTYGVSTYNYIFKHLENVLNKESVYDERNLYVLWEHKRLMVRRLNYLVNRLNYTFLAEEKSDYEKILSISASMKGMMYKWSITHDDSIIEKVIGKLKLMAKREIQVIQRMIDKLSGADRLCNNC